MVLTTGLLVVGFAQINSAWFDQYIAVQNLCHKHVRRSNNSTMLKTRLHILMLIKIILCKCSLIVCEVIMSAK